MKDTRIDPLPADIAALLAREAVAYPEDPRMKAAVLAHTEIAVALGSPPRGGEGGGGGDAGAPPPFSLRDGGTLAVVALAAFLAGGVAGGLVMKKTAQVPASASSASIAAPSADMASSAAQAAPSPSAPPSALPAAEPPAASSAARAVPSSSAAPAAPSARGDLTRERELLDAAHAALARGRPGEALAGAERHAAQWPRGYLGEEREVIIIQALAASGRRGEAAPRAAQFRKSHPKSVLLPAVDAAVPPPSAP